MAKKFIEYSHIHTVHRDYQHQLSFNSLNEAWMLSSYDSGEHLELGNLEPGYSLFLAIKNIVF